MSYIDYEAPVSRAVATALEADAVSDIVYEALVGLAVATTQVDVKLRKMGYQNRKGYLYCLQVIPVCGANRHVSIEHCTRYRLWRLVRYLWRLVCSLWRLVRFSLRCF